MNRIDYNLAGGFPFSTQILDAGQKAYNILNAFGYLSGDNSVIITGCVAGTGGTVTDGMVFINGELMPFKGSTVTAKVIIVQTADARGFEDGSVKPVIYTRYATFGTGGTEFTWTDFRRPLNLFALEDRLIQIEKAVPIGLVAIWGKPADAIPEGWEIHVPIQGTTPVGRKTGDINFGAVAGTQIGTPAVTLDISQMPSHSHKQYWTIGSGGASGNGGTLVTGERDTSNTGGDQPHTNIQPSTIVDFIIFIGFP